MNVFGYAYYKFTRRYKRSGDQYYYMAPITILSMCQTLNINSLLPFIIKFYMNNWILCTIFGTFILFNANYFLSKRKREQYERRWNKEKGAQKRWGRFAADAYVVFSFVTYFASMPYYLGYTGWEWDLNWRWSWAA